MKLIKYLALALTVSACSGGGTGTVTYTGSTIQDDEPQLWVEETSPTLQNAFDLNNVWACTQVILNSESTIISYPDASRQEFALSFDPANRLMYVYTVGALNQPVNIHTTGYSSRDKPVLDDYGLWMWFDEGEGYYFRDSNSAYRMLHVDGYFLVQIKASDFVCSQIAYGDANVRGVRLP